MGVLRLQAGEAWGSGNPHATFARADTDRIDNLGPFAYRIAEELGM